MGEPACVRHWSAKGEDTCLSELLRRGHRWPSLWNISEWIKSGNGEGSTCPSHSLRGGAQVSEVTRPMSDISEFITCQRGSAEGGDTCSSQLLRRGAQMALPVSDISEWIQIEGQGRRGHMLLLTLIKGHRSVCIPDLREFKFNNIIHWHFIEG